MSSYQEIKDELSTKGVLIRRLRGAERHGASFCVSYEIRHYTNDLNDAHKMGLKMMKKSEERRGGGYASQEVPLATPY